MTEQSLNEAIKRLIVKRSNAHDDEKEQARLNDKLTKLYELKYIMLVQKVHQGLSLKSPIPAVIESFKTLGIQSNIFSLTFVTDININIIPFTCP